MKALVATAYGDVDKLDYRDMLEPVIEPGEVKVQIEAAGINPADWKTLAGAARGRMELLFPAILGLDGAGTVIEVGAGVESVRKGDPVLGVASGTFAEQVVAPEHAWAKRPPNLEAPQAGVLPIALLTGSQLADKVDPKPGKLILVTGALGAVGRVAVFWAKRLGATVIAGVRRAQLLQASELGADDAVAIDDDAGIDQLPEVDAVCDTVSGETIGKLLPHLKRGGVLGSVVGEPPAARQYGLKVYAFRSEPDPQRLGELARAVAEGALMLPVSRRFRLADGRAAMKLARDGGVGKVLLEP